ncbi:MAG: hypothetical protein ABS944_05350 [Solibacillus sp.]|jgi:hypothetical protein|uniref:hypothetical protein n=1 Tax=unclassified Solibacillus TaxID=2637870 RepID=UPI0030FC3633
MTDILDFLLFRNEKLERQLMKIFERANSPADRVDALLQQQVVQLEDHKLFLAFLAYLEEQQIEPQQLFKNVLKLPKHQFEAMYEMNWSQVIKLSVTFLTILRTNDQVSYKHFVD